MCFCHLVYHRLHYSWNNKTIDKVIWECLVTAEHLLEAGEIELSCRGMAAYRSAPAVKGSSGETSCKWILHLMSASVSSDWFLSPLVPVDRLRRGKGHLLITTRWPPPIHTLWAPSCFSLPGDSSTVCTAVSQVWSCNHASVAAWIQPFFFLLFFLCEQVFRQLQLRVSTISCK